MDEWKDVNKELPKNDGCLLIWVIDKDRSLDTGTWSISSFKDGFFEFMTNERRFSKENKYFWERFNAKMTHWKKITKPKDKK